MSLALTIPLAMLAALVVGSLCGLFNGFLVSKVGITPILATLGTGSLYTGLSFVITGGPAITTTQLAFIGNGTILGLPIPVIVFLAMAIVLSIMLNRTAFGFNVYMLGTNANGGAFLRHQLHRVLLRTYWLAGVAGGIAGIIFLARTNSAKPDYGSSFILLSVLIAILGGVSPTGGFGTVSGMVLAVLSIQFLSTGPEHADVELVPVQRRHLLPPVRLGRAAAPGDGAQLLRRAAAQPAGKHQRMTETRFFGLARSLETMTDFMTRDCAPGTDRVGIRSDILYVRKDTFDEENRISWHGNYGPRHGREFDQGRPCR